VRCTHLRDAPALARAGANVVAAGEAEVGVALVEAVTADDEEAAGAAAERRSAVRARLYGTGTPDPPAKRSTGSLALRAP
jgi:CPA2 family monovalent cation:H+ antiporter-2